MAEFPDYVVQEAWKRAKGRCECTRSSHSHEGYFRCPNSLQWKKRGHRKRSDSWEPLHVISQEAGGLDTYSNCEILCWPCLEQTP